MKKCAAIAPSVLPVIYWGKKTPGEAGSLERRCSNSQVREALASKGRSMRSSSGVMSDLVTHKAFPFSARACVPTHRFGCRPVSHPSLLFRISHVPSSDRSRCAALWKLVALLFGLLMYPRRRVHGKHCFTAVCATLLQIPYYS